MSAETFTVYLIQNPPQLTSGLTRFSAVARLVRYEKSHAHILSECRYHNFAGVSPQGLLQVDQREEIVADSDDASGGSNNRVQSTS